jgi:hypothetical protein
MENDKVLALAREAGLAVTISSYDSLYKFAALLQQQMEADGWRQCAEGQGTTQYCGIAVKAEAELAALKKKMMEPPKEIDPNKWAFDRGLESY